MTEFHHHKLPEFNLSRQLSGPNVLSGHSPSAGFGFKSDDLQIIYNFTDYNWAGEEGERPHYHTRSDECFIVLQGKLTVEVDGALFDVAEREFCCFPKGVLHAIKKIYPPIEMLVIRAPSVQDKVYMEV